MIKRTSICLLTLSLAACAHRAIDREKRPETILATGIRTDDKVQAAGRGYAVSTQGKFATEAAERILAKGGNLMDAAIAASFVLAVERPQSTGIAGGGFMIVRDAKTGDIHAIDFRERAPLRANENMFLGNDGEPDKKRSINGPLAVAVPGFVAGLSEAHARFGRLPFGELLKPAIELAESGFAVYPGLLHALKQRAEVLAADPAARAIFLDPAGQPWPLGHVLVQKDLARTLRLIAAHGRNGFYKGPIADRLVRLMKDRKGMITRKDLTSYKVKWRKPLHGRFRGYDVYSMPPPSSGGVHVLQFLNVLERAPESAFQSAEAIHFGASALQMAFADRAAYLGDPDFTPVPVKGLTSTDYAAKRFSEITAGRARRKSEVSAGDPAPYESTETTHLSIVDNEGGAIATTQTINGSMGAGIVVPGTGMVLNNEMDDFSAKPGASNLFGAVGSRANAVAPKKTPLSSMSPTLLVRDGKVQMAVGAPGGTRIISCVAQTILNWAGFRRSLYESVAGIRYHHQWSPDFLTIDPPGPAPSELNRLRDMGYDIKLESVPCYVMAVAREGDELRAVADPRDIGTSAGGTRYPLQKRRGNVDTPSVVGEP